MRKLGGWRGGGGREAGGGKRENVAGGDDETVAGRREQKGQVEIEETPRWSGAGAKTQPAGNEWNVLLPRSSPHRVSPGQVLRALLISLEVIIWFPLCHLFNPTTHQMSLKERNKP